MSTTEAEPILSHHFDDVEQQHESSMLGMWAFLATEVMFFGGLILAFVVYRAIFPHSFRVASQYLSILLGGINTVVLLGSSLAMALAVRAAQLRRREATVGFLAITMALGATFLVIKAVEYYNEFRENKVPGLNFRFEGERPDRADVAESGHMGTGETREGVIGQEGVQGEPTRESTAGPTRARSSSPVAEGRRLPRGEGSIARETESARPDEQSITPGHVELFFVLYFFMTGLHAIHLIIGIVLVGVIAYLVWTGWFSGGGETQVEVTGLYWHFIDIVWVFLYPLLYLAERHS